MRVVVDYDLCESNAVCMSIAPEVFEVRDDDFLYVLQENPPEDLRAKVEEAVVVLVEEVHVCRFQGWEWRRHYIRWPKSSPRRRFTYETVSTPAADSSPASVGTGVRQRPSEKVSGSPLIGGGWTSGST